jgi:hypothetical protein
MLVVPYHNTCGTSPLYQSVLIALSQVNPADHIMDLVTTDFGSRAPVYLEGLLRLAEDSDNAVKGRGGEDLHAQSVTNDKRQGGMGRNWKATVVLSERTAVNYSR